MLFRVLLVISFEPRITCEYGSVFPLEERGERLPRASRSLTRLALQGAGGPLFPSWRRLRREDWLGSRPHGWPLFRKGPSGVSWLLIYSSLRHTKNPPTLSSPEAFPRLLEAVLSLRAPRVSPLRIGVGGTAPPHVRRTGSALMPFFSPFRLASPAPPDRGASWLSGSLIGDSPPIL